MEFEKVYKSISHTYPWVEIEVRKKLARKFIIILLIPYLVLKNFAALVCAVLLDLLMHTYFESMC